MAETRSFQEMLADKQIKSAGESEARRRSGPQIVRRLGAGGAALGYGDPEGVGLHEVANALRIQRAARAREFLVACGVVASIMDKYDKPPVELRSPAPIFGARYGIGWMILQYRHRAMPAIKAHPSGDGNPAARAIPSVHAYTEGVLLGTNGTPLAFSGLPARNGMVTHRGELIESQRIGDMNVRELGVPVLANSAAHDVELYMSSLVDLAFASGITAEHVATDMHQAQQ
jgi:hypothetical protein